MPQIKDIRKTADEDELLEELGFTFMTANPKFDGSDKIYNDILFIISSWFKYSFYNIHIKEID